MFREFMEPCEVCSVNITTRFNNTCNDCYEWMEEVSELQHQEALEFSWKEGGQPPKPSPDLNSEDLEIPF